MPIQNWDEVEEDEVPEMELVVAPPMEEPQTIDMPPAEITAAPPAKKGAYTAPMGVDIGPGERATYGLDPRVLMYLQKVTEGDRAIGRQAQRDNWRTNRQQLFGDIASGIAGGAAQIGTTFGETPSVKPFTDQMAAQKDTAEQFRQNQLKTLGAERQRRSGVDARILEHLMPQLSKTRPQWLKSVDAQGKPVWMDPATKQTVPRSPDSKSRGRIIQSTDPATGKAAWLDTDTKEIFPGPPTKQKMVRTERFDPVTGQTVVEFVPEGTGGVVKPPPESAQQKVKAQKITADTIRTTLAEMRELVDKHGGELFHPFHLNNETSADRLRFKSLLLTYTKLREQLYNPGVQVTIPEVQMIADATFGGLEKFKNDKSTLLMQIDNLNRDVMGEANRAAKEWGYEEPYKDIPPKPEHKKPTPAPVKPPAPKPQAPSQQDTPQKRPQDYGEGEEITIRDQDGKPVKMRKQNGRWIRVGGK